MDVEQEALEKQLERLDAEMSALMVEIKALISMIDARMQICQNCSIRQKEEGGLATALS